MKIEDIRAMDAPEIIGLIDENKALLTEIRYANRLTQIENPARIRRIKQDIARLNTVLTEKGA